MFSLYRAFSTEHGVFKDSEVPRIVFIIPKSGLLTCLKKNRFRKSLVNIKYKSLEVSEKNVLSST